jgi:hypothetical protein
MSGIITCGCPITKTLTVSFTGSTPAPAAGYIVKWAIPNGAYNYVTPNPTSSPVTINNVPACENVTVVVQSQCDNSQVSSEQTATATGSTLYLCGATITGSNTHNGLYTYPPYILDVRAATSVINLSYDVIDRPNRIRVFDDNNNEVANSDWRGVAAYSYTWGATLNTATTGIVTFTKTPGKCFYKMVVESYTNTSIQDSWTVNVSCPTTVTPVTPTITYESCSSGYGQYRIDAPSGTAMKIALSATGSLTNNSSTGSCARIDGNITSSTGPTASAVSSVVVSTGTATIGASNTLFVNVTMPGSGYLVINSTVDVKNSSSAVTSLIRIFEVNGSAADITQSVCQTSSTATVACGAGATNYQYSAIQCSTGITTTLILTSLATVGVTYKTSNSPVGECYTLLSYVALTSQTSNATLYSTVAGCADSGCVQL